MINRERKKFGLSLCARRPLLQDRCLSATVSVIGVEGRGYCYIRFDQSFVDFLGQKMPRGVAPFDPCFVEVTQCREGWLVESVYARDGARSMLWLAKEKPKWVGTLRKE